MLNTDHVTKIGQVVSETSSVDCFVNSAVAIYFMLLQLIDNVTFNLVSTEFIVLFTGEQL